MEVSYVITNMEKKLEDILFKILEAISIDNIQDQFSYNKPKTYI